MISGIITVDKEAGLSSHAMISRLRKILDQKRIGHGGTLDPMATGVLPILAGGATHAAESVQGGDKEYSARVRLGLTTDTGDITGNILSETVPEVSERALIDACKRFEGEISQVPPMYSAISVDGVRLYKLARAGIEVEREARQVTIHYIKISDFDGREFNMTVSCSKGTYIRTLATDIGDYLGCGAALSALRRLKTGIFDINDSYTLDDLRQAKEEGRLASLFRSADILFPDLRRVDLTQSNTDRIKRGAPVFIHTAIGECRVYGDDGVFLGTGEVKETDRRPELRLTRGLWI